MTADDWEAQILRAYRSFGINPLDGVDEFGRFSRTLRGLKPDIPHAPINPEFEEKIRREKPGVPTAGRFARKPKASLTAPREPRADIDTSPSFAVSYKDSLGALPQARLQLTPEKVAARQELHNKGIPNAPEVPSRPILDEHILQTAEEAEAALVNAGMPKAQAHEYAMRGLVVTRDGRHFAWVPFDTSRMKETANLSRKHTLAVAKLQQAQENYDRLIGPKRKKQIDVLAGKPPWTNLVEALRLTEEGKGDTQFSDGATAQKVADEFEAVFKRVIANDIMPSTKMTDDALSKAKYDEKYALDALERKMASIDRYNPQATIKGRKGEIFLAPTRQDQIQAVLDAAEWVDDHLPQRLRDMPTEVRGKHLIVEVVTRAEIEALEEDNPITPRFPVASAFAHRGGNRITVITDNIQKKVAQANQAQGQDKSDVLAWNMPAFFDANGGTDFRRALQYTLAHEMGHTYDVNAGKGTPGWEYNMSAQEDALMKMIDAGGMGKYGMTTAGGGAFDFIGDSKNWQAWEGVAEAFAQMILHDQFQPDDLKQPAVIEFMRLFGFM